MASKQETRQLIGYTALASEAVETTGDVTDSLVDPVNLVGIPRPDGEAGVVDLVKNSDDVD